MIRFNRNTSNDKKDEKRFFFLIYALVLVSGMYTGMYALRFGVLVDIKQHIEAATHDFSSYFKYLTASSDNNFDDVHLNFKFNEYIKLSNQRSRFVYGKHHFIKGKQWIQRENIYAKATLKHNGKKFKVKAKLFGKNNDHFRHPYRWSFRVKAKDYIKDFDNGRFNLLQPNTRMYVTDALCNLILKRHDVLSLKYKPINLKINDRKEDVYFVEDFFSKYLIERNGYRDSYIFTFNDLKHPNSEDLNENQLQDLITLKDDIRNQPHIILDENKFDIFLAVSFLAQNKHSYLVDNFHMFYNGVTNKVEPIIREVWFKDEISISSKQDFENQVKRFIRHIIRYNKNLTVHLESILDDRKYLEKIMNDIRTVAMDAKEIKATNEWNSFQDGIYSRFPQAIHLCKNIEPNIKAVTELDFEINKSDLKINQIKTITVDTVLQEDLFLNSTDLILSSGITLDLNGHDVVVDSGLIYAVSEALNNIVITNSSQESSSIVVKNSKTKNIFKHVTFSKLSNFDKSYWHLPAGITFYESTVEMDNVVFDSNVTGDDFVNFFRCDNFKLNNVKFINVNSDAIDSDFSNGTVDNCSFVNVGNDAVDGSGSQIIIRNSTFDSVEDKVISAGEHSSMEIYDSTISNSEISFVSKDDSKLIEENNTLTNNTLDYCLFNKKKEFDFGLLYTDKDISKFNYLIEKGSKVFKGDEELLNLKVVDSVKESLYGIEYGKKSR